MPAVSADHHTLKWRQHSAWALALVFIFLITTYRVGMIDQTWMRDDEEIAFRTTSRDLGYTIWVQAERDVHAPTWFVSFWLWQQVAGSSEALGRFYSILWSMLTLALLYQLARRWFRSPVAGWFAVVALGVNTYAHVYALEIRPYALVIFLATLSMFLFERWLARQTRRTALLYGLFVALMLWVHYFLAFLVIAQAIFALFWLNRRLLVQGLGAAALALVLWLPWLPVFVNQVAKLRAVETETGDFRGIGIGSTTEPTSLRAIEGLVNVVTNGQPLLYGPILLFGIAVLWRSRHYRLALLWGIGVPVINWTINLVFSVYTQRYITYIAVGLALVVGVALSRLPGRIRWGAFAGFAAISLWALPSQLPAHVPFRQIFQQMNPQVASGDVLYFSNGRADDNMVRWQMDHYLTPAVRNHIAATLDEAQAARGVWFMTATFFDAAVQAEFRALEQTHPLQAVVGDCNRRWCYLAQHLQGPPQPEPAVFGDQVAFWGADVDQQTPEQIDVRLWWRVEQPPDTDYSISLQLLDASGQLVAQSDGPVNHYREETVQTSQMESGRLYVDGRTLALQNPLPPGEYFLNLVVYQSWDGARLTLPDGSDTLGVAAVAFHDDTQP